MNALSKRLLLLILLACFFCQCNVLAQVRFSASVSPAVIGKNETAELRLMVENAQDVQQIIPPSFKDFIVVSGPNQESSVETVNGVTRQTIGLTYELQPRAKGNFTIGEAVAKADGKTLKSNAVKLQVTNATSSSASNRNSGNFPFSGLSSLYDDGMPRADNRDYILKKGENVQEKVAKNIFIKVDADKTSCYVGEPVVVNYKLYTRLKSESNITKNPSFNGFSVVDLSQPGRPYYATEKLNGKEYNVYTLRKSQLYPLQAGAMEAEIAEVENTIHFVKEDYFKSRRGSTDVLLEDLGFAGLPADAMQDEKVTLQSKPLIINVKPLPDTNKPASFNGAVGSFTLDAGVEKSTFSTDDAGKFQFTITGRGNMNLLNAPEIIWPDGIESYEPRVVESLNKLDVPISGSKGFEYSFTVKKAGTYTLPAVEYSYFDPVQHSYKIISTKPVTITVTAGTGKNNTAKYVADDRSTNERVSATIFSNRLWIIIPVALLIFAGLFFWVKKENSKEHVVAVNRKAEQEAIKLAETKKEEQLPANPLAHTEYHLVQQNSRPFYETLNTEMRRFLASRLAVPVETINKKRIAEELDKKGIGVGTSLQVQQLLDDIEWQLYTPFTDENKMQEMYQTATNIIRAFDTV
ncbi:MAG: hypothetical protein JWR61_5418 [Ferruginibacter sp.]|uniref:BatD family protein n=1 Tax=Ferruginibacter sp. TaxID=1940288 RepID=UPI002658C215|nr:BatD family protein [Ferruginibacter sp.]MDB5280463.1 hypothetical protein [Ferruginibacter sp.]